MMLKVVQYWAVTPLPSDPSKCTVRLGVFLHFISQTMFKSQIVAGTQSEMLKNCKNWVTYCLARVKSPPTKRITLQSLPSSLPGATATPAAEVPSSAPAVIAPSVSASNQKAMVPAASTEFYTRLARYAQIFFCISFFAVLYFQYSFNQKLELQMKDVTQKLEALIKMYQEQKMANSVCATD